MHVKSIKTLILLGIISITGIITVQVYFIQKSYKIEEKKLDQKIKIALAEVASKISEHSSVVMAYENPVYQYSSDYFIVNTNAPFEPEILEHYLLHEFDVHNILLDFEYGIYDCMNDEMIYGRYITNQEHIQNLTPQLPTCDDYLYYFGIYFPERKNFIIQGMHIWYFFSAILLVVIMFFSYSMVVILKQRRLSRIQKDFINHMTHEFKTPLSSIMLSAEICDDPEINRHPDKISRYTQVIKTQASELQKIVDDLLISAIYSEQKLILEKNEFSVNQAIEELIAENQPIFEKLNLELIIKLSDTDLCIKSDINHFKRSIQVLIDNAIKYSDETPYVTIKTAYNRNGFEITVADKGIGIPAKYKKLIFKKFYRVPNVYMKKIPGTGLGLHYLNQVIKSNHWKLIMESEENKGTKFTIRINKSSNV